MAGLLTHAVAMPSRQESHSSVAESLFATGFPNLITGNLYVHSSGSVQDSHPVPFSSLLPERKQKHHIQFIFTQHKSRPPSEQYREDRHYNLYDNTIRTHFENNIVPPHYLTYLRAIFAHDKSNSFAMNSFLNFDYNTELVPSPCYLLEETLLRKNLELIKSVKERAGVEIILAFKSFALWKTFPIFREYIPFSTASSLSEAKLAYYEMGSKAHTFAPVYTDSEFDEIAECSSHITFNSVAQYLKYRDRSASKGVSCGIRVNPEFSHVETDLYNPCAPGSRLGVTADALGDTLPEGIEGLHFHTLCESTSYDLEETLSEVERRFGKFFRSIKWLNMGGGHLMMRKDYDTEHLISLLSHFKERYPHLNIILEPGSAFTWRTGVLVSTVEDIVENKGIKTAMLNVSFACHAPDCLEMPYQPYIIGAQNGSLPEQHVYRIGGNSCLSGDFIGDWSFPQPLKIGDRIIFEDMIHYTTVKTTMFNGVTHPSIAIRKLDGTISILREYTYEDYKTRMC